MENRDNLLKCALDLFTLNGYDAVGVQTICDAAGITKPTLYHYFGSKSGLLNTLLAEELNPFLAQLESAANYRHDITDTLYQVAQTYFNFGRQKPHLYRFYLSMWFAPHDSEAFKAMQPFNERQQNLLENLFAAAALDHGNMQGRQRTYAASFLGMVNTYVMLALNGFSELDENFVRSLLHQFMHGIFS